MPNAMDIAILLRYGVPLLIIWAGWNIFEDFWLWVGCFSSADYASMAGLGSVFVACVPIAFVIGWISDLKSERENRRYQSRHGRGAPSTIDLPDDFENDPGFPDNDNPAELRMRKELWLKAFREASRPHPEPSWIAREIHGDRNPPQASAGDRDDNTKGDV